MRGNQACSVYIGNLDEKVSDRVLYEIMIQAGRVVDLHIPRDKETNRHKGYAFAEYETEETADYAVKLFSGLVSLNNKTLKFAISGQDKNTQNSSSSSVQVAPVPDSSLRSRPAPMKLNNSGHSQESNHRLSTYPHPPIQSFPKASPVVVSNGYRSNMSYNSFDYGRQVFGAAVDSISRYGAHSNRVGYDSRWQMSYTFN